jgi:uncharacterized membrane protein YagU involved in acid resistance
MLVDALLGAVSGLTASWVMERSYEPIMSAGSERTRERERRARGDVAPATVLAAEAASDLVGRQLDDEQKRTGGEVVHYATGAAFGALFGLLAPRVPVPLLAAGAGFGIAVWLVNDELLVPALGLSKPVTAYPASVHAKALASHLVYGAATDAGFRVLDRVLH